MASGSSSTSRFRFRDHSQDMVDDDYSTEGLSCSESSSISSNSDDDSELQSMTAKGISHLCSELLELKKESEEEFQQNVFSNYSAFLRIFNTVESMKKELMHLQTQAFAQKRLVKECIESIAVSISAEEITFSTWGENSHAETSSVSSLGAYREDALETLDKFLLEHRLDEAISFLKMEERSFVGDHVEENFSSDELVTYTALMLEKRAAITDQLISIAKDPRVRAAELQKALGGLCHLGEDYVATQLLLKYYHSRISSAVHHPCSTNASMHGADLQKSSKLVFSMIFQAAKSFVSLHGDNSRYVSKLTEWACEETEEFANFIIGYIRSMTELSGRLSLVVEAVQLPVSHCSLLEVQGLVLQSHLLSLLQPCIDEALHIHVGHFKKVIRIFTSTDIWGLGRYLVSGILSEASLSTIKGQQPEYCLLTGSGQKFIMLFQTIAEDIYPLIALHMEGLVLKVLMDLFTGYINILEGSLTRDNSVSEVDGVGISPAESGVQMLAVIVNLSSLVLLFTSLIRSIFNDMEHLNVDIETYLNFLQETCSRMQSHFIQLFIRRSMEGERNHVDLLANHISQQDDSHACSLVPSVLYQGFYFELLKLQKSAEENLIDSKWIMDFLGELMEAVFSWISNHVQTWSSGERYSMDQHYGDFMQFVLDIHFLLEISRSGGYLSENILSTSTDIVSRKESTLTSAGLNLDSFVHDDGWPVSAAKEALKILQGLEHTELLGHRGAIKLEEEMDELRSWRSHDTLMDEDSANFLRNSEESVD